MCLYCQKMRQHIQIDYKYISMGLMSSKRAENHMKPHSSTSLAPSTTQSYFPRPQQRPQAPIVNLIESEPQQIEAPEVSPNEGVKTSVEPSPPLVAQENNEESVKASETGVPSVRKAKEKIRLKGPFTLANFQKHLRQIYEKDPTLNEKQFFELAKKLFNMIEEDKKILINISKKWSNRFHKMMCSQRIYESGDCQIVDVAGQSDIMIPESHSNIFSEPESAEAEVTVENTSNLWRKHTLKLIEERNPTKATGRKSKFERDETKSTEPLTEDLWVVNKSMVKTLENRRAELRRLQSECLPEGANRRKSVQVREGSSGKKKRSGRPKKEFPCIY